ncbi:MAG: 16S rRNA (uracil(1498)-N(3))-methyltransferase [Alphaproteobacteria bacterium]|nr:16S rRNA (uracil(1498)-N(3))-methyltransferase [Alphaproteobacteria bacterium]
MKNIPRIYIEDNIKPGITIPLTRETLHYLTRVMRTRNCLVFGGGNEYSATVSDDDKNLIIGEKTSHIDPSNNITLMFAPIKHTDDLINMATQMGVARILPVITARTVAHHINWGRMQKIATEAAEQSNRNSVPEILEPVKFSELDLSDVVFADERVAYGADASTDFNTDKILIGPEGGFSDTEFEMLDAAHARGVSLGKTILRAETAAIVALAKILK